MHIVFVCLGNICRSTMAQSVLEHLLKTEGITSWHVDSAGTSDEEFGNPPHPGTKGVLSREHIEVAPHTARKIEQADYDAADLIVYMDNNNKRALERMFLGDPQEKCVPLLSFAPKEYTHGRKEVADPWWTGDFDATFADVLAGCEGLVATYATTS